MGATTGHGLDVDHAGKSSAPGWRDVLGRVSADIREKNTSLSAAGVAFFGFLAFIPGLAAMVSIYGLVADPAQVQSTAENLFDALPSDARELLTEQLTRLTSTSSASLGLGLVISIVLALWSASSGVGHLVEAIDISYGESDDRGPVVRRALAVARTLAILVIVAATIGVSTVFSRLGADGGAVGSVTSLAAIALAAAAFVAILSLLYRRPNRDAVRWRWLTPGAVAALVGWVAITLLFRVYVDNFGSYNETYGTLAAIVIMLFWLYLSALVVLVGALLNAELANRS